MAGRFNFRKHMPVETYTIVGIVGSACVGATYYVWKLSQGSEVVWDRKGDWKPWDKVKYDQNTKFLSYNNDFWEKRKQEALARQNNSRMVDEI